jgi:outer membrane lipoprotein SlyB
VFDITLISLVYPNGTVPVVGMLVTPIRERSDDMKSATVLMAAAVVLASTMASADEVLEVHEDRAVGGGFGGLSGFMLGAAAGGPIGALVGGGIGYLVGQGAQQAAGLEQTLYVVKRDDGSISRIRTSDGGFLQGQHIERNGAQVTASAK